MTDSMHRQLSPVAPTGTVPSRRTAALADGTGLALAPGPSWRPCSHCLPSDPGDRCSAPLLGSRSAVWNLGASAPCHLPRAAGCRGRQPSGDVKLVEV